MCQSVRCLPFTFAVPLLVTCECVQLTSEQCSQVMSSESSCRQNVDGAMLPLPLSDDLTLFSAYSSRASNAHQVVYDRCCVNNTQCVDIVA
jgi:hypothetical protein